MDATSDRESELRFERPPVQQVFLGAYLSPLLTLQVLDFVPILMQWKSDYPLQDEIPHMHLWRPMTSEERSATEGRRSYGPLFSLQSSDNQRTIQVQHDRLVLSWRFEGEGSSSEYPGYDALRSELGRRLEELTASLKESANADVAPERADLTYTNLIDFPARDFIAGVLSSWNSNTAALPISSAYSGIRFGGLEGYDDRTDTLVAIETGPDGEGVDFTIDVECMRRSGEDILSTFDYAHQAVLEIFSRLSGDDLMAKWGRK